MVTRCIGYKIFKVTYIKDRWLQLLHMDLYDYKIYMLTCIGSCIKESWLHDAPITWRWIYKPTCKVYGKTGMMVTQCTSYKFYDGNKLGYFTL